MNIYEKLLKVQIELKAPKGQYNTFGKYNYRSCEDIQEGVKPLLKEVNCILTVCDEIILIGDRYYVKASAIFRDCESELSISNTGFAREELDKKGMDSSQITGAASSYARKYALNGLFCIDDVKDSDADKPKEAKPKEEAFAKQPESEYKCEQCSKLFTPFKWNGKNYTAKDGYEIAKKNCGGRALCNACKKEAGQ